MTPEIKLICEAINRERSVKYFYSEFPCALDSLIEKITNYFKALSKEDRDVFIEQIKNQIDTEVLTCFSVRAAVMAVKDGKIERVFDGLLAYVIENLGQDHRDSISSLELLYHSAKKINNDPVQVFDTVAEYATDKTADFIKKFARSGHESGSMGRGEKYKTL